MEDYHRYRKRRIVKTEIEEELTKKLGISPQKVEEVLKLYPKLEKKGDL